MKKIICSIRQFGLLIVILLSMTNIVLADTYQDGANAQKNRQYAQALQLYQQAIAETNDARAYNALGTMYEMGSGVPRDYKKAFEYYDKAAVLHNAKAYGNLAALIERGLGARKNMENVLDLYFRGMTAGDGKSINNLGVMALKGEMFKSDYSVAWAMFAYARDKGDLIAPGNLRRTQNILTPAQLSLGKQYYARLKSSKTPLDTFLDFYGLAPK